MTSSGYKEVVVVIKVTNHKRVSTLRVGLICESRVMGENTEHPSLLNKHYLQM